MNYQIFSKGGILLQHVINLKNEKNIFCIMKICEMTGGCAT